VTVGRDLGLTLAGGGNRAFYQTGVLEVWGERIFPRLAAVGCVSAGSCVITTLLSGRTAEVRQYWEQRRAHVTKNFAWGNLLRGRNPTPHAPIFRDTLVHTFIDGGLERIRAAPFPIWVLTAEFPRALPAGAAVAVGLSGYSLEKRVAKGRIHPEWGKAMGFKPMIVDARACETVDELTDLIMASSSTPPFTPVGMFRGTRLLDGGMVDNVPAFVAERHPEVRHNLIVLTRPYPRGARWRDGTRLYVAPTTETPANRWDYTSAQRVWDTIAMGAREAAGAHAAAIGEFLDEPTQPLDDATGSPEAASA
jgi:predicted acylesterase/phospholipase RssA